LVVIPSSESDSSKSSGPVGLAALALGTSDDSSVAGSEILAGGGSPPFGNNNDMVLSDGSADEGIYLVILRIIIPCVWLWD